MPDTMADRRIEMGQATDVPLILGGHSFINQLGNDPSVSEQDRYRIVESCLEHGIRWFDTTYQPERVALGRVFQAIGRRNEATIMAWNFFTDFSSDDPVGKPEYYRPHHIDAILEELQTDYIDCLVAILLNDMASCIFDLSSVPMKPIVASKCLLNFVICCFLDYLDTISVKK